VQLGKPAGVNAHLKISSLVAGIAARGRSGLAHRAIAGFACHPDLGPLTTLVFHELVVGHPYAIERVDDRGPDVAERGASDSLVDGIAGQAVLGDGRRDEALEVDKALFMVGASVVEADGTEGVRAGTKYRLFDELRDRVRRACCSAVCAWLWLPNPPLRCCLPPLTRNW
jgi:hypothetical protein